ncbi:MAG: ExeM/NucH family extracellular endonuclease [Kouleothrix sp.]|nr:ExeM/NucH family extracellular endonuclease [Kouleothrix sp.]
MPSSIPPARWRWLRALAALALLFTQLAGTAQPAMAVSTTVVISQVYGGAGCSTAGCSTYKNDYIELFNRGTSSQSLNGWSVQYASATGTSWSATPLANVSLAPGQYYLIAEGSGANGVSVLPTPDTTGSIAMSATAGKVALVNATTALSGACPTGSSIVDLVGFGSTASCYEGAGPAPAPSTTTADVRSSAGCTESDANSGDFTAATPNPRNTSSPLSPCSSSTNPAGTGVASPASVAAGGTTLLTVAVTPGTGPASTGLTVIGNLTAIGGSAAQSLFDDGSNGDVTAGDNTFSYSATVDAGTGSGAKSLPFTVGDAQSRSGSGTIALTVTALVPCSAPDVTIGSVQGTGDTAASGTFTVQGVVVGDYEGASPALRGFYLQDAGDGNPATSDGIFVFEGDNLNRVSVGQVVQVTGPSSENQGQSQLSSTTGVELCGSTGSVTPTDVALPFASASAAEAYEGMLVRFPQTLYVTEHFQLGRFGQVLMSSSDRLRQPTNVTTPGALALALQAQNDLNQIIVDDDSQVSNPDPIQFGRGGSPLSASNTLRGADSATGMVGVMTYTWSGNSASGNAYRLRPIGALGGGVPSFQPDNARPTTPAPVGGTLKASAANLLNYFNTFGTNACTNGVGGAATDCRGADNATEFDRQWPKTVAALVGGGADVIGVMELENDGYGPTSAIQDLVGKLNTAAGAGTYAFIDADQATGQTNALGTDAIKVAIIYKPAKVTPVGTTAALNSTTFVNGGDGAARNRPSLAQAFQENATGARFILDVNHLKSKGSACDAPDAGDGQGNCNAVRTNAANELTAWLASNPTGTGDPDVLIVGDLNSYAKEDPIAAIKSAGFTNLIESLIGPDGYSYAFDGQWGYLDHALASGSLAGQVAGITEWHINADEPSVLDYNTDFKSAGQIASLYAADQYRVSDHDPVIVGLSLTVPAATAPSITTQPQSQTVAAGVSASLSVVASGTAPLSYQWYEGASGDTASPISGATGSSFSTPPLSATTSYWVRVSNSAGSADSSTATITVQQAATAPSITTQPQSQTVAAGVSASLSVVASGTAPLSYQWYEGASGNTASPVSGATGSSFSTPPLSASASYWVRVSNSAGHADSDTATITVTPAAGANVVISQVYGGGGNTYLNDYVELYNRSSAAASLNGWSVQYASASGTGNFSANGVALLSGTLQPGQYYLVQMAAGSAGAALPTPDASGTTNLSATAGKVVLANTTTGLACNGGSTPCSAAQLAQIFDLVGYGSTANFYEGTGPAPAPSTTTAALRKSNGAQDTNDNAADFATGAPNPRNSQFGVVVAPSITTQPQSQTIAAGVSASLSVVASGTAPLSYQWYEGASGDTASPVSGATGSSFSTPPLSATASYWVRVSNSAGSADSNTATITVTPAVVAPSITTQPQSQTVAAGVSASLSVVASGTAPLTYQWYEGASGNTASPVSGATGSSFSTPPLSATASYWVRVSNSAGSADSNTATITVQAPCSAPDVTIGSVEGTGDTTPVNGQSVTVQGVVVLDYEGASPALRGFYLQDAGDGNPATSDGIFVFENDNANRVSAGQVVQVTGIANENQGQTQLGTSTAVTGVPTIEQCGATATVTPADVTLPVASATALEAYEGMLVRFNQTLYVTEHFQLGRFGQVVLSSGDRLRQPTNVVDPGAPAIALQAQNDLNRLIVDDDTQAQNPDPIKFGRGGSPLSASNTLRGGDTVDNMVGVMTYTWAGNAASGNAYRLRPVGALGGGVPNFQPANPRPASAPSVGGSLRVVGMNLLNFFNTFDGLPDNVDNCTNGVGGAATDCRGADTQAEFDRQWPKTVAAIQAMNPDVIGVNEIENDGYGPTSAIQFLVDKLNAATAPGTYAFIDVDANTGQVNALGTDAIKVGMIYKPARVTPVGTTAALNSTAFVNGGDGAPRSRPSLAQAFQENATGARFIVDANHLKSKGSACDAPDAGDGQGNCNTVRKNAATALVSWLASDPTGTGDPDILLIGDYNSYAKEEPISIIKSAGFTNLIDSFLGADAYSYVFDGQWGYLDHALGSASMVGQVSGVGDYHINADEPSVLDYNTDFKTANLQSTLYAPDQFRVSDHDSVIVGLSLNAAPVANDDTLTVAEDASATTVNVLANDTDANGDSLTVTSVTQGAKGAVTLAGGVVKYTPSADANGADSFSYTISDGRGGSDTGTVSVTITPVNDAPVANADTLTLLEDASATTVNVLANDTDVDGDSLTVTSVTQGAKGVVTLAGGVVKYTPNANASGADSFSYTIADGHGGSATGTVSVTITPVNDAPVANADTLTVLEDASATTVNVLANDTDVDGDSLAVTSVTQGAKGAVTLAAGVVKYTPNANANDTDSFSYTIADGHGGTATATVSVTITPVNDAPTAVNDSATVKKNKTVTISVLANDFDVDGNSLSVTAASAPAHGSVVRNANGTIKYTPQNGYTGSDSFTYTISDGNGGLATATVTVTVTK